MPEFKKYRVVLKTQDGADHIEYVYCRSKTDAPFFAICAFRDQRKWEIKALVEQYGCLSLSVESVRCVRMSWVDRCLVARREQNIQQSSLHE